MKLSERLLAGDTVLTAWSSIASPAVIDLLAHSGYDAVTLDMQHGAHDEASVHAGLRSIAAQGRHCVVRVPVGRFDMASRALDFGAEAIIAPMINTADDARRFSAFVKYPPLGERSWGPGQAMRLHGYEDGKAYLAEANARTVAFAMIETRAALERVDEILAVDGIDGVFVGPSDFSISWTAGKTVDPHIEDMEGAIRHIAERAKAHGKQAGIFVFDPKRTAHYVAAGYRFLTITTDESFLKVGAKAGLDAARGS